MYIKAEKDKFNSRPMYMVTDVCNGYAVLQKLANNQLSSRRYEVPLSHIFPVTPVQCPDHPHAASSDSDSEAELGSFENKPPLEDEPVDVDSDSSSGADAGTEADGVLPEAVQPQLDPVVVPPALPTRELPQRNRRPPSWYGDRVTDAGDESD